MNRTRGLFYEVGGVFYKDLREAQKADLMKIIPPDMTLAELIDWLLSNSDAVAELLTTTPRSRIRKTRKDKGVPRRIQQPTDETIWRRGERYSAPGSSSDQQTPPSS